MGPFLPSQPSPTHSRASSGESESSFPPTPTFSTRGHNRYSSSTSSLVTNPDSPANPQKTTLHDLVEDPAERDDQHGDVHQSRRESLCICDTPFCYHRERECSPHESTSSADLEWIPGDDFFDGGYFPGESGVKRRPSNEHMTDSFTSRLSHHFSKRFGGHKPHASVSTVNLRSAPTSRSSSLRLPSTRSSTAASAHELRNMSIPSRSALSPSFDDRSASPPRSRALSSTTSRPVDISIPGPEDDACERQELATTPLLPPVMTNYFSDSQEALRSPLTSPSVASPSVVPSMANTPVSTPITHGYPTPPLSTKGSAASINKWSSHVLQPASEIPHLAIAAETDRWAIKLGHANFHIYPEPYLPEVCDAQNCRQLRDDWEAARVEFMRQAARVSDNHGVTSHIYKFTEQKWAEIDAAWRANYDVANAQARASGEDPVVQPLAETQALQKMPSLQDPKQPSKFPVVEEADIVGPMVQYAKIQHRRQPSKKSSFLKMFTDPASLLGKSAFGLQR
ncbi:hypothetical protein CERZMDRAFT_45200 [Cercospora zeae-maydis SCOH1-5]|uniref:Only prolin and serin are matching in the corresponding protein n=1 Tax=Cercospora zeae-maydis SCOH1-5 TaxID=717836 RepID=A0A6A6FAL1_9PEZI|nr:hypothetical protein CERZMDRAFT_45200 [Cercospora zeae-maydis SCOH1-5]